MRLHVTCAALAAALATFVPGSAAAQEVEIAYNVSVTSDYVYRGFSQTDESPAVQGGVDLTAGSWYAGVWASNVDFGDGTDAEIDFYGGFRNELEGFDIDLGVIVYTYVDAPNGADYNFVELAASASRAIGPVTAGLAFNYSPDFFGADSEAFYTEANVAFEVAPSWTVSGAVGKQVLDVTADYTTWNAGVTWAFTETLGLDVRYHDTDVDGPLSDGRVVASLTAAF